MNSQLMNSRLLGKKLNKNILNRSGILYLPQDVVLNEKHLASLSSQGIVIAEDDVEDVEPVEIVIAKAVQEWKDIFQNAKNSNQIFIRGITEYAVPLIRQLSEDYDLHTVLTGLLKIDDYTYHHSIAVASLSTLIGKWLDLPSEQLHTLTVAALLHDIGKSKIPSHIINKTGRLMPEEYELVKMHTSFGYELIRNTEGLSIEHALVALQHHERLDGSGYPNHLKYETTLHSRIVAIADVFHAMLSRRPYKEASPFYQAIREVYDGAYGSYDPGIVTVFTQKSMEALIGSEVRLTDGRKGRIVQIHPHDLCNPLIMCEDQFIDLAQEPSIRIEQI